MVFPTDKTTAGSTGRRRTVAYLAEPHAQKTTFFRALGTEMGRSRHLRVWTMSPRGFAETRERAHEALARAKRTPRGPVSRSLKLAFLKWRYNCARRYFTRHPDQIAVIWQGLTGARRAFAHGVADAGALRLFAELSPLPGRLTLDSVGVNAEGSVPQDPAFYDDIEPNEKLLKQIRDGFVARAPRRADVGQTKAGFGAEDRFLFVPLQVPNDSQMTLFAGWCGGLLGFVRALAQASVALPEGWHLRLKEHPSSKLRVTDEIRALINSGARMVLDNESDSFGQIAASQGVVTVNSSMGLQAMFYDKPVIATGRTFWAIAGAAQRADSQFALAEWFGTADTLPVDRAFRARFLTWLAESYYVTFDGTRLEKPEQLHSLIERARLASNESFRGKNN